MNIHLLQAALNNLDDARAATFSEDERSMIDFIALLVRLELLKRGVLIGGVIPNRKDVLTAMAILHGKFAQQIMGDKSNVDCGQPNARADELVIATRHFTCSAVLVQISEKELLAIVAGFNTQS